MNATTGLTTKLTGTSKARRPSKTVLERAKLAAIVLSAAAFTGALGGVIFTNPATKAAAAPVSAGVQAPAPVQSNAPRRLTAPRSGGQLTLPSRPQAPLFQPRTRTRGS